LEGYRAAGKTGTAQKIVDGRYSDTKYVASFIGFAPLPRPRLTVVVQIDEPKGGYYGGEVCAPYFQKIAQESLMQLRVPPDRNLPLPRLAPPITAASTKDYLPNATPVQPLKEHAENRKNETHAEVLSVEVEGEWIVLPDFRGLAKREVLDRCVGLGIRLQASGSGVAVHQSPSPGTRVPIGAKCSVTFAKGKFRGLSAAVERRPPVQDYSPQLSENIRP
jgi:hypothetical protein